MRTYWNTNHGLHTLDQWQPNCWVQVTCPTADDVDFLQMELGIPDYFLDDIADTEERARYDYDDGWILIILRIPYVGSRPPVCREAWNKPDLPFVMRRAYGDDRVAWRGLHGLRGSGVPPVPFHCGVVPEAT